MLPTVFIPLPETVSPGPSVVTTALEKLLPRKLTPAELLPLNKMVPPPPIVCVFCATRAAPALMVTVRPALIVSPSGSASLVLSLVPNEPLIVRSVSTTLSVKVLLPLAITSPLPSCRRVALRIVVPTMVAGAAVLKTRAPPPRSTFALPSTRVAAPAPLCALFRLSAPPLVVIALEISNVAFGLTALLPASPAVNVIPPLLVLIALLTAILPPARTLKVWPLRAEKSSPPLSPALMVKLRLACRLILPTSASRASSLKVKSSSAPLVPLPAMSSPNSIEVSAPPTCLLSLVMVSLMVISRGSRRMSPCLPCTAPTSTKPRKASLSLPDTSTWPPSPPAAPPRAVMAPSKRVSWFDHTTTSPPAPCWRALAVMRAPATTVVLSALATLRSWPCQSPPMRTSPPAVAPLASIAACSSTPTR